MTTKAKKETPHEKLKGDPKSSACYTEVGTIQKISVKDANNNIQEIDFELIDKVIYYEDRNICPFCNSKATFHRRIQESGDFAGNVWKMKNIWGEKGGFATAKLDYCLDCYKDFLIELYVYKKVEKIM